jgi:hypothetical protein
MTCAAATSVSSLRWIPTMIVIRSRSLRLIVNVSMSPQLLPQLRPQGDIFMELERGHSHGVGTVRPSIIVNDTVNGHSSAFTHLNVLVEVANRIQEFYGIHDGEVVNREIRVPMNPSARPNMAAVDPVAAALAVIAGSPQAAGKTFHLCHPSPQTNAEIFGFVLEAFGIKGKINLHFVQQMPKPLTRTEEMIARAFNVYLPYLNRNCAFDLTNTRAVVPGYDAMFGSLGVDYLQKVITFQRAERKR